MGSKWRYCVVLAVSLIGLSAAINVPINSTPASSVTHSFLHMPPTLDAKEGSVMSSSSYGIIDDEDENDDEITVHGDQDGVQSRRASVSSAVLPRGVISDMENAPKVDVPIINFDYVSEMAYTPYQLDRNDVNEKINVDNAVLRRPNKFKDIRNLRLYEEGGKPYQLVPLPLDTEVNMKEDGYELLHKQLEQVLSATFEFDQPYQGGVYTDDTHQHVEWKMIFPKKHIKIDGELHPDEIYEGYKKVKADSLFQCRRLMAKYKFMVLNRTNARLAIDVFEKHAFRGLPPSNMDCFFDDDEDADFVSYMSFEPSWPHLRHVYTMLTTFIETFNIKNVKNTDKNFEQITRKIEEVQNERFTPRFFNNLIALYDADGQGERTLLSQLVHTMYATMPNKRSIIKEAIEKFVHEFVNGFGREGTSVKSSFVHNKRGIADLLKVILSVITGFSTPLRDSNRIFFRKTVLTLHKVLSPWSKQFNAKLLECVTVYMEKDALSPNGRRITKSKQVMPSASRSERQIIAKPQTRNRTLSVVPTKGGPNMMNAKSVAVGRKKSTAAGNGSTIGGARTIGGVLPPLDMSKAIKPSNEIGWLFVKRPNLSKLREEEVPMVAEGIEYLALFWPYKDSKNQIRVLSSIQRMLQYSNSSQFSLISGTFGQLLGHCMISDSHEVQLHSNIFWTDQDVLGLYENNIKTFMPALFYTIYLEYDSIVNNIDGKLDKIKWRKNGEGVIYTAVEFFQDIDPELFKKLGKEYKKIKPQMEAERAAQNETRRRIFEEERANEEKAMIRAEEAKKAEEEWEKRRIEAKKAAEAKRPVRRGTNLNNASVPPSAPGRDQSHEPSPQARRRRPSSSHSTPSSAKLTRSQSNSPAKGSPKA